MTAEIAGPTASGHASAKVISYMLFDWTAFCAAAFTAVLAFLWIRTHREEGAPVMAVVILIAAFVDAAQTLAVGRLMQTAEHGEALLATAWAATRTVNALILLGGAGFVLTRGDRSARNAVLKLGSIAGAGLVIAGYLLLHAAPHGERLLQTALPAGWLARPYDLVPLGLYIAGAVVVFPRLVRRDHCALAFAIWLSMIPNIAAQAHVAFGSGAPFDGHAHAAIALKTVAYCIPLWGLLDIYSKAHRREIIARRELSSGDQQRKRIEMQSVLLTTALESAANGVVIANREGCIIWVNQAFTLLTGYSRAETIGKNPRMLKSGRHEPAFYRDMWETITRGETWHGELINRRKDGSLYTEEMTLTPVVGDDDQITHFIAIKQDVTARYAAERALIESSAKLSRLAEEQQFLLDNMNDFVYRHDTQGVFHYLSPTVERVTGYSPAEWLRHFTTFLTDSPANRTVVETTEHALRTGEACPPYVLEIRHKDGSTITLEVNERPYWEDGRIAGIVGVARDVTDRERANRALEESEQKYRTLFEESADALLLLDGQRFVDCNDATVRMLRYESKEDVLSAHPSDLSPPKQINGENSLSLANQMIRIALEKGTHRFEWEHKRADGEVFPVEVLLTALPVGGKRALHVVWRDITERRRDAARLQEYAASLETMNTALADAIESLQHANTELTRKNEELDEYTYVASHDLQEPLRKIVSFGELLRKDAGENLAAEARRDIDFISDAARRMQTLVQDLLRLSRTGRSAMRSEPVDLNQCVELAIDALSTRVSEIDAEIVRADLPTVRGDETLLTQLFQNLISNALKFIPKERRPVVRLTAEHQGDEWILGVQDNGIGIKQEYSEQIFAPFKRLHGRSEYPGTGIGLAICRKTVERHSGRIWVESEVGQGSHFRFTIKEYSETSVWERPTEDESSSCSQKMTQAIRS